ncbi:DUF4258 domain-containing protein, partial [Thiolapillus sp.]|uniref:DUF4258 domain-containing protein n=1 Tax=Thiolapillus sp. TaxID=2017437 RepID=UPI0025F98E46
MDIEHIINSIRNSRVRITDHADEEAFDDNLTYEEIYSSVIQGEIIEDLKFPRNYSSHHAQQHSDQRISGGIAGFGANPGKILIQSR